MRGLSSRSAWLLFACAVIAFAVYGSLIPFDFTPRPPGRAWREFQDVMAHPRSELRRSDFLANILLFVPVGFGLAGSLLLGGTRRATVAVAAPAVLAASVCVSVTIEFMQMFTPERISSRHDVIAQTIGCAIGIAAWIAAGPSLTHWLLEAARSSRRDRLARLLAAYVVAWIFVNLAPFNFTYDLGELATRVRTGRITLVPFAAYGGVTSRMLWDALITALGTIPLGVFGLAGWKERPVRHGGDVAFAMGAAIVLLMEIAQVFIRAHAADAGDVLSGWIGVAIGAAVGGRVLSADLQLRERVGVRPKVRWAAAGLTAWIAVLCVYSWLPFAFVTDSAVIGQRLTAISFVPFASHQSGSPLSAFSDVLTVFGLAIPIGLLAGLMTPLRPRAWMVAGVILGTAALFAVLEAGQLFLPARVVDPTDVLVGVAGSAVGLALAGWLDGR